LRREIANPHNIFTICLFYPTRCLCPVVVPPAPHTVDLAGGELALASARRLSTRVLPSAEK